MTISKEPSAPLVVLLGITGQQGGSVFKALAGSSKPYRVKGISRDASKPAAQALAAQGADIISLTVSAANVDQLTEAFKGADYVFAVTDFWQDVNKEREIKEGKAIADAVKAASAKTLLFSSLPNYSVLTNKKYNHVDHFDGKADVEEYAKSLGINYIGVQPACYTSNFLSGGGLAPRPSEDGSSFAFFTTLGFSDQHIILLDVSKDYGLFILSAIESGAYKNGDTVLAASDVVKGKDLIATLEKSLGKKVNIVEVPVEAWIQAVTPAMGETVATEFGEMLATHNEFGYFGGNLDKIKADQSRVSKPLHTLQKSIDAKGPK